MLLASGREDLLREVGRERRRVARPLLLLVVASGREGALMGMPLHWAACLPSYTTPHYTTLHYLQAVLASATCLAHIAAASAAVDGKR